MLSLRTAVFMLLSAFIPFGLAQEGHPLVGTWQGNWGSDNALLTVIINWNGEGYSGIVNPGPGSGAVETVTLDSSRWWVEMTLPVADAIGNSTPFNLEGTLETVTSRTRTINAIWRYRGQSGSMILARQSGP